MKRLLLLLLLLAVSSSLWGQNEGDLDLPDVFIWGEDRSELYGIGEKGLYLFPYLKKGNFMRSGPGYEDRTIPGDWRYKFFSILNISAGAGTSGEYLFRATQGKVARKSWFFDYDIDGSKKNLEDETFDHEELKGIFSLGKIYEKWNWQCGARGISSDSLFERNLWKVDADIFADIGKFSLKPEVFLTQADINSRDARECGAGLKFRGPVLFNHWIICEGDINSIEIEDEEKDWTEFSIKYLNTEFRDFSFMIDAGYRSAPVEGASYGGRISGDILNTGYSVFAGRSYIDTGLYLLHNKYQFLCLYPGIVPDAEVEDKIGISLNRNISDYFNLSLDLAYKNSKNHLLLVNDPFGLIAVSMDDTIGITEASLGLEKDIVKVTYYNRYCKEPLPYFYDQVTVSVITPVDLIRGIPLELSSSVNYITGHELWRDTGGAVKEDVDPFISFNIETRYDLNSFMDLRIGGENLLGQDIVPEGGYMESEPEIYIILNIGYKDKKE
ncbi:hypothetical protein ACFLUV_03990 [Elusimicrobiota bacterium]